ncbi:hypothetical protein N2152v2_002995 [Parachlorella kessleri]
MVSFKDLKDDSSKPLDLEKEVERLRLEVQLAKGGCYINEEEPSPDAVLQGFQTPDDFVVKEQSLKYENGDVYQGETLGNLRHGQGKHTCSDGTVYEGGWKYDKRDGKGKIQFKDGLMYEGDWKEDLAHGSGVAQYQNGSVYIGDFKKDHRWGWGTQYFANQERYEGEWEDDKMTGKSGVLPSKGRYTLQDGSYFEGEWADGQRVKGKAVSADGSFEYSGGWKGELRHGYGVMYQASLCAAGRQRGVCKYMGEWQADLQCGQGKCLYVDGSAYDGEWKDGMRHGKGKLTSQGYKYDGQWQDDKQHGQGGCQMDNGDKYIGEFQGRLRHGAGRCIFADGAKYEGQWEVDKRHGKGSCIYANGDKYQGEWANDRRHGYGVCKFADGTKFRGEWDDDCWVQSAAEPSKCRVAGPGITRAVAGQQAEFLIQARDEAGNRRLSGGDEFQVLLTAPSASLAATVTDKGDGTYSVAYTATVAGVYQLSITVGAEEHVADSPYPLRVLPGKPCPRKCEVVGEGRSRAIAGQPASFSILIHDQFGNRWFGDNLAQLLPLEVSLEGPSGQEVQVVQEPQREGCYACCYTPPAPGFYRLHVSHGKAPLPRTPFSVQVHPASTAAQESSPASNGSDSSTQQEVQALQQAQQVPSLLPSQAPIRDEMRVWEEIAALAYAADGVMEGWNDEDKSKAKKTPEEKYVEENPGVAVVENLEDMWLISKLQRDRKAKEEEEKQKKLQEMKDKLEQSFGPAQRHDPNKVAAEVKEIIQEDLLAHSLIHPVPAVPAAAPPAAAEDALGSLGKAAPGESVAAKDPSGGGMTASTARGESGPGARAVGDNGGAGMSGRAGSSAPRLVPRSQLKAAAALLEELD